MTFKFISHCPTNRSVNEIVKINSNHVFAKSKEMLRHYNQYMRVKYDSEHKIYSTDGLISLHYIVRYDLESVNIKTLNDISNYERDTYYDLFYKETEHFLLDKISRRE